MTTTILCGCTPTAIVVKVLDDIVSMMKKTGNRGESMALLP